MESNYQFITSFLSRLGFGYGVGTERGGSYAGGYVTVRTIITNAEVVTMNAERDVYRDGFAVFEAGRITAVGPMKELETVIAGQYGGEDWILDGKGGILMPGMVNLHTHMGMIPFRGLGDDCKDRLRVFLLPMEQKAMDAELVYLSTRYAAAEMLLAGVTTVFDMYYYEAEAARAMDEMGIRGIAGETIMEQGACDFKDPYDALSYGHQLMENYKGHPRISACVAPHGTTTCPKAVLKAAWELDQAYGAPFSLHTAEMDYEMRFFKETYSQTPASYLDSIGVLGECTLAAHCIHMTEADMQLFSSKGVSVAHCIGSNAKAAKGVSPVSRMRELGISVGLGTDGPASGNTLDIFTQMKLCADFHKNETKDRSAFPAEKVVEMATVLGAKALHMEQKTGSIEVGKRADLVLVETRSANMFPVYDPYSALVYSAGAANVDTVFVEGQCVVREGRLTEGRLEVLREELERKMEKTAFAEVSGGHGL